MHIGRHIVQEVVLLLGDPIVERWAFSMQADEFARLKQYLGHGRCHDVTSVIVRGDELVVIRKHDYPPGAYRAPSGGIYPEESFLDGARREAREETGLDVELESYLLQVHAGFSYGGEDVSWTTHVLKARPLGGDVAPIDRTDVESARWISWRELLEVVNPILMSSGRGGLAYRARLHERVHEILAGSG